MMGLVFPPHSVIKEYDKNQVLLAHHSQVQLIMEGISEPVKLTTLTIITINWQNSHIT